MGLTIECLGLGHRFGRRALFANLDLTVTTGEVVMVTGSNGAGKSTLLRLIAGLLHPAAGEVVLVRDGAALSGAERRQAVGYLSPETMPYRPLTVAENLRFFARLRGLAEWPPELPGWLGLAERLHQPVSELSSGYLQRVKLAMALVHEPEVLILDEPGVTLDDVGRAVVGEAVARQRSRGIALVATNDPRELTYGTRVVRVGG